MHFAPSMSVSRSHVDFDRFLASVERRALGFAELALGHREDALDVVQDAMLSFLAYRNKPDSEWNPLFWAVLRRQITDRYRRNSVRQRVFRWIGVAADGPSLEDRLADQAPEPDAALDDQRLWGELGLALRALPRRQREAYMLRELEGLSVAEAAAAMGCSEGSVKTHLFRAMSALRITLENWR